MEDKTTMTFFGMAAVLAFFAMFYVNGVAKDAQQYAEDVESRVVDMEIQVQELQEQVSRLKRDRN